MNQVANQGANQPMIQWLMIKQQIKDWNGMLSFLISFRQNEESIAYRKSRMQSFQARLLSRLLKLLPTPLIRLRQSMAWTTITIKSKWIIEWHSRTTGMMRSSVVVVNSPKLNLPIGKGQNNKVSMYLPVFPSPKVSVLISVQNWIVGFILIQDVSPLL